MRKNFWAISGVVLLLGCVQGVERQAIPESTVASSTSTTQVPKGSEDKTEGYCRSLISQVAVFTVSGICPDIELCFESGDNCFVGSTNLSEMWGREFVVVLDDADLLTYSRKLKGPWSLIRDQNVRWLKDSKGLEPPDTTLIEMSLVDVTKDGVDELVVRAGPEEILTAIESRDLAVFKWSTDTSSWIRMTFPRPVYPDWGTDWGPEAKDPENRLLRWGFVRNGYVYEEVGYLGEGGHIMDKAIKYIWRNGEFVQIGIANEGPACSDVAGTSNGMCYFE